MTGKLVLDLGPAKAHDDCRGLFPPPGQPQMKYLANLPTDPLLWVVGLISVVTVGSFLYIVLRSVTF